MGVRDGTDKFSAKAEGTFSAVQVGASSEYFQGSFNISVQGTFPATVALKRSFDAGVTWEQVTFSDGTAVTWSAAHSGTWSEAEAGVKYRLDCTSWTAPITWRISQ